MINVGAENKNVVRTPYITLSFILASWIVFIILAHMPQSVLEWLASGKFTASLLLLVFHPVIHVSFSHLFFNTLLGFAIIGYLIEFWMTLLTRIMRYVILLISYTISLFVSCLSWVVPNLGIGRPAVGLSGMIFSGLAFTLIYYGSFYRYIRRRTQLNAFAPFGIGFVSAFFVLSFLLSAEQSISQLSSELHILAFFLSFAIAALLFKRRVGFSKM